MAKLTLHITAQVNDALEKIKVIRDKLGEIENKPIKIGVQASGLDAIAAKLKTLADEEYRAAEAAAKLANAEARKINAQTRAAESAAKLGQAQKAQAQSAKQAEQASRQLAVTNEQLQQKMMQTARQSEYLRQKGAEMAAQYLSIVRVSGDVAGGQAMIASSMGLVIRNAGTLEAQVRSLTNAYQALARASSGGGSGAGGARQSYFQPTAPSNDVSYYETTGRVIYEDPMLTAGDYDAATNAARAATDAVNTAAGAAGKARSAFNTMREGMSAAWAKMSEGTPISDALGDSIGNIIVKITTWQVVNGIVAGIKRSFTDALETMRAVDQELTNIAKVSDLTATELERIGESAYDVASKYGVAADQYLSAVYTFQKAGLGDSAEKLAELATKTMLVGDTTADIATKFLISANAAWQYGGKVEALNKLVDEADILNNRYAVSLSDIAEGLPIVGAAAAQVGMTAEQTMAAISTIVASTGQSATKAATALRAIIANLIKDTGEFDGGIVVTEESIKDLNLILNQYASDALKAADAEGKILDPMKAVAAIAQAANDEFLNQSELFDLLYGEGGKLRVTQLTALVNSQEMYNSMLKDTADAAGTADKEIGVMLESWNSKTQILTNSFTQFISHLVDSKAIKTGIDALNGLVKVLDSNIGKFAALTVTVLGAAKAFTMLARTGVGATLVSLAEGFITASEAVNVLTASLLKSPLFWAVAVAAAYSALKAITDDLNTSYKEQKEELEKIQKQYEETYGAGSDYAELQGKAIDELTDKERERLAVLEAEAAALHQQVLDQQLLAFYEWRKEQTDAGTTTSMPSGSQYAFSIETIDATQKAFNDAREALRKLNTEYADGTISATAYKSGVQSLTLAIKDDVEAIRGGWEAGAKLTSSEWALLSVYESMISILTGKSAATNADAAANKDNADAADEAAQANEKLQKAFEEVDKKGSLTYGTLEELEALYPGLSRRILDANGNLTAEGQAAMSTKSALYQLISEMIAANTTGMNFDSQIAALQELASAAGVASSMISAIFSGADLSVAGTGDWDEVSNMTPDQLAQYRARSAAAQTAALLKKQAKDDDYIVPGGGGGGSSKTQEELAAEAQKEELNRRKQAVADEKAKYNLMEAQGASAEKLAEQAGIIQGKLHDQAEYMREIEADYSDIASVSKEWWDWESKKTKIAEDEAAARLQEKKDAVSILKQELAFLKASGAPLDEQIAKQKQIQRALHDQAEYMRSIKADEKDITALSTEWWDIQKDILESTEKLAQVLKDQIADVLGGISDALSGAAEAATQPLQEELDALIAAHDAAQDRREEEEKILAVEKARIALVNAERDRSVRQYNAAAGQWEWVANPKNLESARKSLADAEANLAKYREEQLYKARKESLETEIDGINGAFDTLKSAIEEAAQAIRDGKMSYEEAYAYIKSEMHRIQDDYGIDMTELLGEAENNLISGFAMVSDFIRTALQTADPGKAIQELTDAIRSGIVTDLSDIAQIMAALNGEYAGLSEQTARIWALTRMQANSVAWHLTDDQATRNALHEENMQLGGMLGLNYEHGKWYDQSGNQVYTLSNVGGEWTSTLNAALQNVVDAINSAASGASASSGSGAGASSGSGNSGGSAPTSNGTTTMTGGSNGGTGTAGGVTGAGRTIVLRSGKWSNIPKGTWPVGTYVVTPDGTYVISAVDSDGSYRYQFVSKSTGYSGSPAAIYDRGGILHGRGGIKATARDEMVLPPDATSAMLRAENNGAFAALLNHLGIVTAAANSIAGFGGGVPGTNIGEQHNGDIYKFGSISISEREARSMTVYDLAQMARNLQLVRN